MAHNEAPIGKEFADEVILTNQAGPTFGTAGRVICSGAKLHLDTGSAWEVVTSA